MTPTYLYSGSILGQHPSRPRLWTTTSAPADAHGSRRPVAPTSRAGGAGRIHRPDRDRPDPPTWKDHHREVPCRPRRLRRCRRLGRPQPARPPERPVLAGLLIEAGDDGPGALHLRLRDLGPRHAHRPRSATRAAPSSAAGCSPTSAAACPAKPVEMVLDGARVSLTCGSARFSLQTMPVEDYPTIPRCRPPPAPCRATSSPTRSPRPSPPPAATTCCRCSPASGSRSRARRSRCSPPTGSGSRSASSAGARAPPTSRSPRWCRPRCSATPPSRSPRAPRSRSRCPPRGTGDGLIGFEGAAPGGVRRTTTRLLDGEFPKVRSLFPSEQLTIAKVDKAALVESVKRVALVAERNTAVQLAFSDGVLTLDAGSGDEAQASESITRSIEGDDLTTGFNPQFLLDGLDAIDEPSSSSPSPRPPSRW